MTYLSRYYEIVIKLYYLYGRFDLQHAKMIQMLKISNISKSLSLSMMMCWTLSQNVASGLASGSTDHMLPSHPVICILLCILFYSKYES